jgi:hypothetical protein
MRFLRSTSVDGLDCDGSAMRASIDAQFGPGFHPDPTRHGTFVTAPLLAVEHARRWQDVEVAFGGRHFPGAGVARDFDDVLCPFTVFAVRPWTRELAVFVTVRRACLHCSQ